MSVMGFQKSFDRLMGGWVGGWVFFCNLFKPPNGVLSTNPVITQPGLYCERRLDKSILVKLL